MDPGWIWYLGYLSSMQIIRLGKFINDRWRQLGHSDLTVLMRYLDETNEDLKNVYDRANSTGAWKL